MSDFDAILTELSGATGGEELAGGNGAPAEPEKPAEQPAAEAAAETPAEPAAAAEEVPTAQVMQERWRKLQRAEAKLLKREEALNKRQTSFDADDASLKADLKALLEGDYETKDSVARRRLNMPGIQEYFEHLSRKILKLEDGKSDAGTADLRKDLADLRKLLTDRDEQDKQKVAQQERQQVFLDWMHDAVQNQDSFPELAEWTTLHPQGATGVVQELYRDIALQYAREGKEVDAGMVCAVASQMLRSAKGQAYLASLRASKTPTLGNGTVVAAKPPPAPASGKTPGTSVAPSLATQPSPAERPATPEEREQYRARLIPLALREMGLLND